MKKKKVFVTGHNGLVGSSIVEALRNKKNYKIITAERKKLDLLGQIQVNNFFKKNKPDIVVHAAGKVGGILHNKTYPAEFIFQNSQMALNVINSAYIYKVKVLTIKQLYYHFFEVRPIYQRFINMWNLY